MTQVLLQGLHQRGWAHNLRCLCKIRLQFSEPIDATRDGVQPL